MMSIYADPELPYKKGPLLDYAKPIDIVIPSQHETPRYTLPVQDAEQEENAIMEETTTDVDMELDVNEIF
jgi:hypothetical protein